MIMKNKLAMLATVSVRAFNNGAGWKLDADGKVELKDGNPVYVDASGREMTVQGDTISRLNGEAKAHREAKEAAEAKLKSFEGLDPNKAREAIELASKIDQKTLIDAGKVDEVKQQITQQFTQQMAEKDAAYKALQTNFDNERISNLFSGSEFVRDRIAVPRDMFEATFGRNFKIEDGKIAAYDKAGNRLMSKSKFGEPADINEAFELLVEAHPQKDVILKADSKSGTGNAGAGGGSGKGRILKRAEFDQLPEMQKAQAAAQMGKGELSIVD